MSDNVTLDEQETHFQSVNYGHNLSYDCRLRCFAQFMNRDKNKSTLLPSLNMRYNCYWFKAVEYQGYEFFLEIL